MAEPLLPPLVALLVTLDWLPETIELERAELERTELERTELELTLLDKSLVASDDSDETSLDPVADDPEDPDQLVGGGSMVIKSPTG